jgi:hypothetical protein
VLLRSDGDAVIVIGQASHAWLSGQLARVWGNPDTGVAPPEPYDEVCLAAEQHDVGMSEWDLAPTLDPGTGRPHDFLALPIDIHLRLWTAAPQRMFTQSRYAALLVSLHGTALYERRDLTRLDAARAAAVRAYLSGQRTLQERLAEEVGADRGELERAQRLILALDALSLALCLGWDARELERVPAAGGEEFGVAWEPAGERSGTLSPWPFGGRERVVGRCEGRRLEGRYEDEPALHAALERAPRVGLEFELTPG